MPSRHSYSLAASRHTLGLPWLLGGLAALLLVAQLLLGLHQTGHLSDDGPSLHCEICLLGGGLDHATVAVVSSSPGLPASPPAVAPTVPVSRGLAPLTPAIRAPPESPLLFPI